MFLGAQKNHLIEYQQHMFWLRNKKIIFSYTLLSGGLPRAECFNCMISVYTKCHSNWLMLNQKYVAGHAFQELKIWF